MICPKCKKKETSILKILNDKFTNIIQRKRKCSCGHEFSSFEIEETAIKRKRKKPLNRTIWMDWRIITYARFLGSAYMDDVYLAGKEMKANGEYEILEVRKINKKPYFWLRDKKGNKRKFQMKKKKTDIIKDILKKQVFWECRNFYNKNSPVEDKNNPAKRYDELYKYEQTIADNIKKKKYNRDFFINNDPKFEWWKYDGFWTAFITIR